MSYGLSQDSEVGLSRVYFFENLYVPFVFEAHDCGAGIADYCLLKCENVFHVADNAFIAEYAFESCESVFIEHSNDGIHAH